MHERFSTRLMSSVCVLVAMTGSAAAEPLSGRYGPLILAIRGSEVRGVFSEERLGNGDEDAPQFSCLFLLRGRLDAERAAVDTWFPGEDKRIAGTLDLGPEPSLRLAENHGGCAMTSGDMVAAPYALGPGEAHPDWIGAGLVTAKRAVLRRAPVEEPGRARPYLVEFDAFAVLERRGGWIHVAYVDTDGPPAIGWMRSDEATTTIAADR